jgi:hypothetical protein
VPNPGDSTYSQGLTQLTYPTLYAEENPFDPLTNLQAVMRTTIRSYRHWGNRWDRAIAEYLTGSEDEACERSSCPDWNGTTGQLYTERIVNIVWEASQLEGTGDRYPTHDSALQAGCGGSTCWFPDAPPRSLWASPSLPFNWTPPSNDLAYGYVRAGADANRAKPISYNTWDNIPARFYTTSPAPQVAAYVPPAPTALQAQQYPAGHTVLNAPHQDT